MDGFSGSRELSRHSIIIIIIIAVTSFTISNISVFLWINNY